jgi:hypothetical protein
MRPWRTRGGYEASLATTQERALIFGCGAAGRAALPHVASMSSVVGFVDNNASLHHGTVMGHTVYPPASLPGLNFDHIYIASVDHAVIRRQLTTDLGVSDARITVVTADATAANGEAPEISPFTQNELSKYLEEGFHAISGWLYMPAVEATLLLADIQSTLMAPAPVCEIGVWEGRYLTLLSFLSATPRRVLGIDPFIHASGTAEASAEARRAQIGRVRANLARYARRPALVSLLERDSKQVTAEEIIERLGGRCQFMSVDGDHTAEGCLHDLRLAEGVVLRGGIVSVDDIPNMTCPGVIEGVMRHGMDGSSTLAPFLSVANKLFLTHKDFCETYRVAVLQRAREGRAGQWGAATLAYYERMKSMQVPVQFIGQDLLVCP